MSEHNTDDDVRAAEAYARNWARSPFVGAIEQGFLAGAAYARSAPPPPPASEPQPQACGVARVRSALERLDSLYAEGGSPGWPTHGRPAIANAVRELRDSVAALAAAPAPAEPSTPGPTWAEVERARQLDCMELLNFLYAAVPSLATTDPAALLADERVKRWAGGDAAMQEIQDALEFYASELQDHGIKAWKALRHFAPTA